MKLLDQKVTLITGASRGIGKEIALELAKHGANIAFTDLRLDEQATQTEKEIKALGVNAKFYASDASSYEDSQKLIEQVSADFSRIDILVNNAGITRDTLLLRMSEKDWDSVIAVNLKSVFNLTKAVQPIMLKQREGSIINISSIVGIGGNAGQANYSASKAGIIGFTKSVAKEIGSRGIRCNAVAPGFIVTEMTGVLKEEMKELWLKQIALRRAGTPHDVAQTVLYLASPLSSYITGQVLRCDGGLQM